MSTALRERPSLAARLRRAMGILLVFVAAGPPIGGLAFLLLSLVEEAFGRVGSKFVPLYKFAPLYELRMSPGGTLFAIVLASYVVGAAPIGAAGVAIGIKQAFLGRTRWWMALGAGFVAGVAFDMSFNGFDLSTALEEFGVFESVLILSCVVAIMLCWRMVRSWHFGSVARRATP
jgi:hypothetical protein